MAESVAGVWQGESLVSVAESLAAGEIGTVVVEGAGGPSGLISERDLVNAVAAGDDLATCQAADIMTTDLIRVGPDDTIASAAALMIEAGVRHLPVMDGHSVIGVVSIRDVLAAVLPR